MPRGLMAGMRPRRSLRRQIAYEDRYIGRTEAQASSGACKMSPKRRNGDDGSEGAWEMRHDPL